MGWSGGWLVGCLVHWWLVNWLVCGCLVGSFAAWWLVLVVCWLVGRVVCWLVVAWLGVWLIVCWLVVDWSGVWLLDGCLVDWEVVGRVVSLLLGWLIG